MHDLARVAVTVAGLCSGTSLPGRVKVLPRHYSSLSCKNVGSYHHMNELAKSVGCDPRNKISVGDYLLTDVSPGFNID